MRFLGVIVLVTLTLTAYSQSKVWTGGGDGTSWSDGLNWSPTGVPGTLDNVVITNSSNVNLDVFVSSNAVCNSLTLDNSPTKKNKTLEFNLNADLSVATDIIVSYSNPARDCSINVGASQTLSMGGIVTLTGAGSEILFGTGSTMEYSGIVAQNIIDIPYENIAISGSSRSGNISFDMTTLNVIDFTYSNTFSSGSFQAPSILNISGNVLVNSDLVFGTGTTVIMTTNNDQIISGTGNIQFSNLDLENQGASRIITNTAGIDISETLLLGGQLDFNTSGGSLTFLSSASGTAEIGIVPSTSSIIGNIAVQRYFNGSLDRWRNFGVPLNGGTVTDIVNAGYTINGNDLAYYDELVIDVKDSGWVLQSTFGDALENGRGYSIWTRSTDTNLSVEFTGTLNVGDQTMPVSYTSGGPSALDDGWNFIANPFQSTIDANNFTSSGLMAAVYVWDGSGGGAGGVYRVWNGSDGDPTGRIIAPGQAFWVQANAAPSLTIPESAKATGTASTFLRTEENALTDHLKVTLSNHNSIDNTFIHFRTDTEDGLDNYDAHKLGNGIFNLYTINEEGIDLSINTMSAFESGKQFSIPLAISNIYEGSYTLNIEDLQSFEILEEAKLYDQFLDEEIDLTENTSYTFQVTSDPKSEGDRFLIYLRAENQIPATELTGNRMVDLWPNPINNILNFRVNSASLNSQIAIQIVDVKGQTISDFTSTKLENSIDLSGLEKGLYFLQITDNDGINEVKRFVRK